MSVIGHYRGRIATLLTIMVTVSLTSVGPAQAVTAPSAVGLVSFIGGSTSSLTIVWPRASRATKYQIFMSSSYNGVLGAGVHATTRSTTYRATGLTHNRNYFFQVRALNGTKPGSRSSRVGHSTSFAVAPQRGPTYSVMTYNVCSRACERDDGPGSKTYYTHYRWVDRSPSVMERITTLKPDVVALQEAECGNQVTPLIVPPDGYALAKCRSAKMLFYKTSRFDLAPASETPTTMPPHDVDGCWPTWADWAKGRTGYVFLGHHGGGCRYAVWAELVDKATSQHVIFVSVHLVNGNDNAAAAVRATEIRTLLKRIGQINPQNLRVVYAGDFNSHKGRSNDYIAPVFHDAGYYDAYDQAIWLRLQHFNSYNDFNATPTIGTKWGDHVDHVWVDPRHVRVLSWFNAARIVNGKYAQVIGSDHSPLLVRVQVN